MTTARAIRLAVEALMAQRHIVAPTAHMRALGIDAPATRIAGRRYDDLTEAIQIIERLAAGPVQTRLFEEENTR